MPYVTVGKENGANIDIYYKDWGKGQPIVFSHGWVGAAELYLTDEEIAEIEGRNTYEPELVTAV